MLPGNMTLHHCADGPEMTSERITRNVIAAVGFALLCALCYEVSHRVFMKYSTSFQKLNKGQRADFAARVHSTVHAIIVPTGVLVCIFRCRLYDDIYSGACPDIEIFFAFTVGYFIYDLGVTVSTKLPLWQVFVFHHIVGIAPYFTAVFIPGCGHIYFIMGLAICVEVSNITMNIMSWMEVTGRANNRFYTIIFYTNYIQWLIWRTANVYFLMVLIFREVLQTYGGCGCTIPAYITGICISIFCTYIWLGMLTVDLANRWRVADGNAIVQAQSQTMDEEEEGLRSPHPATLSRRTSVSVLPPGI
eukprot:Colp12_sorted_trinity150504_noHs@9141